jgi:hypothetical protein
MAIAQHKSEKREITAGTTSSSTGDKSKATADTFLVADARALNNYTSEISTSAREESESINDTASMIRFEKVEAGAGDSSLSLGTNKHWATSQKSATKDQTMHLINARVISQ